ncbi:MAG: hypothetical protein WA709_30270 [Stellaceae bacterium]
MSLRIRSSPSGTLLVIRELVGHSVYRRSEIAVSVGFPDQAKKFPDGPN